MEQDTLKDKIRGCLMAGAAGCIISEYDPIDTPEKRQWRDRYCEMKPAGIGVR